MKQICCFHVGHFFLVTGLDFSLCRQILLSKDLLYYDALCSFQGAALFAFQIYNRIFLKTLLLRLEYKPMVEIKRFELLTPCLQGRCSPN